MRFRSSALAALSTAAVALAITTCRDQHGPTPPTEPPTSTATPTLAPSAPPPGSVVLVGAGDIASCTHPNDTSTAKLLDSIPGTVFTTGENAMPSGATTDYTTCYDPTWGRHKARTFPAPGEVDYKTPNAAGYFGYFGANAGDPTKGYYSYGLGAWHIVVLNSSLSTAAGSPQEQWLKADLAANPAQCTLAYWHYPMFYSGTSTVRPSLQPLWNDLYAAGAAVVLNAHTRNYERFAPQTPAGVLDTARGIREFVVGTGGLGRWSFYTIAPNSEVRAMLYGVLQLTLSPGRYSWQFIPIPGTVFSDSGSGACHGPTTAPPLPVAAPGGPYSGTEGTAITFDGSGSSDPGGSALTYAWTFGDGASGSGAKPTHPYTTSGSFTVMLTVTNAGGAASSPATTTVTVANVAPAVNAGPAQTVTAGSVLTLSASFSDPGTDGPWAYTITWGDGSAATTGSATSQGPITATHSYATVGTDTARVAVTDKGGATGTGQAIITVTQSPPPVAVPGGPYPGTEGTAISFDGSGSSDPGGSALTYAWTFGDGASGSGAKPTHAYTTSGSFTVTLTVTNARGTASTQATTTATVANVAPAVNAGPAQTVTAGSVLTLSAGFSDPGTDGPWAYTITWGDGTPVTTGSATSQGPISATHSYATAGTATARVAVTDKGGATGTGQAIITVTQSPPPVAVPGGPYAGTEGTAISFDGSGSSDPGGTAITYAWTFGDGASGSGAKPTHAYTTSGSFTVTLTVTNARGTASTPGTTTATVANVAPAVSAGPAQSLTAGSVLTLSASFTDPGTDGPWAYTITWGDGSPATAGTATSQGAITVTHTYAVAGTDTARVAVTDKGGATGTGQAIVTVTQPPPPVAVTGGPYAGTEGTAISFDGSGSSDPGGTALTYAWTFGDGASGSGPKPTHAYTTSGSFTVTLTVTNARGTASTPVTTGATVANVAPTVNAGPAQTVTAGSVLTLSASFSDPGPDGPWSYAIAWGDGSPATTGSAPSQGPISATHAYAVAGTATVSVAVTDKGGATGTGQAIITVTQPPPPATAVTFVGAGDIAECTATDDEATARILDTIPGSVFALGDNAYPNGTLANYLTCYDPSWGRHKYRTYPAPGNHDFDSSATAAGYFAYFGPVAGTPGQGYYSFDLGAWHIIVLNSSNAYVSTAVGSPQELWLKADLAASTKKCQLALFHHPRFYSTTSSAFYPTGSVKPFWDDLYAAGAELIINGHMHDYERFAPQTPAGAPDSARGIRQIIVGTGGGGLDRPNTLFLPTSQAYITGVFGVLRLTLGDGSYAWQFIPAGPGPTDAGSGTCH